MAREQLEWHEVLAIAVAVGSTVRDAQLRATIAAKVLPILKQHAPRDAAGVDSAGRWREVAGHLGGGQWASWKE